MCSWDAGRSGWGRHGCPWGFTIPLTVPYVYNGGHLLIEIRHPGSDIVHVAANSHFLDAVANQKEMHPYNATFEDGYRAAEVCDAIVRSSASGARETITYR